MGRWVAIFQAWWKTLAGARRADTEMDDEMQFHLDCYRRDLVKRGLSEEEAEAKARREFGSRQYHKEDCRQAAGLRLLGELATDLRYGLRMMLRDRALTLAAVASLAIGIGANTAMFSVAKTVIFDSLHVKHPEQLRLLAWRYPGQESPMNSIWGNRLPDGEGNGSYSFSYAAYRALAERSDVFAGLAAFNFVHNLPVSSGKADAEVVSTQLVSGNYFDVLGVTVSAGRALGTSDMAAKAPPVAVISDGFWSRRFGRSPEALGSVLRVNSLPVTIVGVAAEHFRGTQMDANPEVLMPLAMQPAVDPDFDGNKLENAESWWLQLLGRKNAGVSDERARTELDAVLKRVAEQTLRKGKPGEAKRMELLVKPGSRGEDTLQRKLARPTYILWGLSGLVLMLACTNVANLLLARASARQREMAMRLVLGANRGRLIRQLLTEGSLLAAMAGGAGLVTAYVLHRSMPVFLENQLPMTFDWQVGAFAITLAVATALLFGLAPALQASRIQESSRVTQGRKTVTLRRALVVLQVAMAAVLLIAGGLFSRTLSALTAVDLGVDTEHLLLVTTNFSENRYPAAKRVEAMRRLTGEIARIPGVRAASMARDAVASGGAFLAEFVRVRGGKNWNVGGNVVDTGFFDAAGIAMLRGRAIDTRDTQKSRHVAVINERLARLVFPGEDPIGKTFNGGTEIVGICGNSRLGMLREEAPAAVFVPFSQLMFWGNETMYVRTMQRPESMTAAIRKTMRAFDRDLPVAEIRTQSEQVDAALTQERLFAALASSFAVLSLVLGCVGVYGVTQFSVVKRTVEIGIRMALGAQRHTVVAAVLREGLVLVCAGLALGVAGAVAGSRLIAAMLYGVKATDAFTIAGASGVLLVAALTALWQPARRASKISPMSALRHE